ncbi:MAG: aspartate-semialdehyde dehydrogenase [bacterium]|nr:aspartate-semialdehyde dehydrogenase [bacterium]
MRPIRLAIVGATGHVGQNTLLVLDEWQVPLADLKLYASAGSAGKTLRLGRAVYESLPLESAHFECEFAILALSAELSREWAPRLTALGVKVIDHSSAFRMDSIVPLVIPEINADTIEPQTRLVANPNCSASVILMALAPLAREFGLKRVIASTYQSVSGAGYAATDELRRQIAGDMSEPIALPRRISGNLFPEIGALESSGYCGEETKVMQEIRKILCTPELHVSATTVRVPVEVGHSAAVSVELHRAAKLDAVITCLNGFPGLVCDGTGYSTPLEIAGKQEVHVGRVRLDPQEPQWLHFWVTGDNLRKGAASNAIQVLQYWASR